MTDSAETDQRQLDPGASRTAKTALSITSVVVAALTIVGSLWLTDDAFPFAPFRMFSYGNSANSVVKRMTIWAHLENGDYRSLGAESVGLRRSELEEQTPWGNRVSDEKLQALVDAYNSQNDLSVTHLVVLVKTTQLRDGQPLDGETTVVIGDWANDDYTGPRTQVDLPLAEPWPGYGS